MTRFARLHFSDASFHFLLTSEGPRRKLRTCAASDWKHMNAKTCKDYNFNNFNAHWTNISLEERARGQHKRLHPESSAMWLRGMVKHAKKQNKTNRSPRSGMLQISGNALRAGKLELVQKNIIAKICDPEDCGKWWSKCYSHAYSLSWLFHAFLDSFATCKTPTMSQDTFQLQLHWIQALRSTSGLLDTALSKDIQTNRVESVEQNEGDVFYLRGWACRDLGSGKSAATSQSNQLGR